MSVRSNTNKKDHLRDAPALALVNQEPASNDSDPLIFWNSHPKKRTLIDLTGFRDGRLEETKNGAARVEPFKGRPELIFEMAPIIKDHVEALAGKSVYQILASLRSWWRILDRIEHDFPEEQPISSTLQLGALHGTRGAELSTSRMEFSTFLLLANKTRVVYAGRPLFWDRPPARDPNRKLPPAWQTDLVRRELKHKWFETYDRWLLADELMKLGRPVVDAQDDPVLFTDQERLLRGYQFYEAAAVRQGNPRPTHLHKEALGSRGFESLNVQASELIRAKYPDAACVRTALLLCMATTGWNQAVFLQLDVNEPFIEAHPRDPTRYILRGFKARGGVEQVSEGLFKTQASAGFVIQALIKRSKPLREALQKRLEALRSKLVSASASEKNDILEEIENLSSGVRSPWLYVVANDPEIHWLNDEKNLTAVFLSGFIAQLNSRRQPHDPISDFYPSDLRDAFAAHVYNTNGGSIFAVMKALGHRSLSSTKIYLGNTLLAEQHRKLYGTFSVALWSDIRARGIVDPSILAKWSRDGMVTEEERGRLYDYRDLMRSRIGIGCKDPTAPPRHIAPDFKRDGTAMCHVQRCLLCADHAVIFPESLSGISKRFVELEHLQSQISVTAFIQSSFGEEMENAAAALEVFAPEAVHAEVSTWRERIARGEYRVVQFDGARQGRPL